MTDTASPSHCSPPLPVPTTRGESSKLETLQAGHRGNAPFAQQDFIENALRGVELLWHASVVLATRVLQKLSPYLKELLAFGKTRVSISNLRQNLSKFVPVERLLTVVVVT